MRSFQLSKNEMPCAVLNVGLGRDWKTPAIAKSLLRNFQARRRLLTFVLAAFHHADYAPNQTNIEAPLLRNLVRGVRLFDVVFEDHVEHFVGRECVAVHLTGTEFCGWRLLQASLRNYRAARIHVSAKAVDHGLWHI